MRTIKFKAKTLKTGEWAVGDLVCSNGKFFIKHEDEPNKVFPLCTKVDPDTVCEFTGFLDKNGNEIYEGDVIHIGSDHGVVVWRDSLCCFSLKISYEKLPGTTPLGEMLHLYDHEVVGNIHEPEWKHHGNYPQRLRRKGKIN